MCVYIVPEEGEERRSGRSHFWPNTNRTVIDGKIVVSSAHDGSLFAPTVDLHDVFPGMFYEDDIHPEIQMPGPANSAIHLEHLYQQKRGKKEVECPW